MLKKSFFTLVIVLLSAIMSNAQVPQLINYQAILNDALGNPITGVRSVQFSIYDSETEGNALWSETQNVIVTNGLCNVLLGAVTLIPHSVFDGGDRYFSLKVGDDPEMTPRKRLVSVGYAFHSNEADSLDGYSASDFVRSIDGVAPDEGNIELIEGTNITIEPNEDNNTITISASGSTGGGDLTLPYTGITESSATAFSVTNTGTGRAGYFKINNSTNDNQVIYGETNGMGRVGHFRIVNTENDKEAVAASTQGTGPALSGYTIGNGPAVYGRTDGDGEAGQFEITGSSSSNAISGSTNGTGHGVYGKHSSSGNYGYLGGSSSGAFGTSGDGNGVFGSSATSNGVKGYSVTGTGVDGYSVSGVAVSGETSSESGRGVYGENTSSGNYGYLGGSANGVFGFSVSSMAVKGETSGESGYGVFGKNTSSGNYGHLGGSSSGVFGTSSEGSGVYGYSASSGDGVVGRSVSGAAVKGISPNGIAVSVEGDLKVTGDYVGDLKVTGAFKGDISSSSGSDGAPFPRPAYDSGWVSVEFSENKTLTHNVGGDVNNYVVDMQLKDVAIDENIQYDYIRGINNEGIGGDARSGFSYYGANYHDLTAQSITIFRQGSCRSEQIRIRIWVYK